ncbi:MAG: polysaccharide biosynthesis C-terminal domain-containing protein [Candidatus Cloacimonadaceae bacterium]
MSFSKNISHNLITQVLKIIFGMLTGILVARALGPARQGDIAYIILIFTLLGTFGHLGIISATSYFQKKSSFERRQIFSTNFWVLALFSLLITAGVLGGYQAGWLLASYNGYYIAGGLLLMVGLLYTGHHQAWLTGDERIIENNRISLIVFFLKTLAIVILWLTGVLSKASFFIVSVADLVLWFILLQSVVGERLIWSISLPVFKAEMAYGSLAWASSLFAYLHYRADQIMIKSYLGSSELGIYTVAVTIAELLFLFPTSISNALYGRLYNLASGDDGRALISRTLRVALAVCLLLCGVGFGGSFLIPFVYGKAYAAGTSLMLLLLPGVFFACAPKILSPWFFSSGRPQVHLRITFICLALNIALNAALIPRLGSAGAALASTLSYIIYGLYYLFMMKRSEAFRFSELLGLHASDWQILKDLRK